MATAGSTAKRLYLRNSSNVSHVVSSRTTVFAEELSASLAVPDVVLNSLTSPGMPTLHAACMLTQIRCMPGAANWAASVRPWSKHPAVNAAKQRLLTSICLDGCMYASADYACIAGLRCPAVTGSSASSFAMASASITRAPQPFHTLRITCRHGGSIPGIPAAGRLLCRGGQACHLVSPAHRPGAAGRALPPHRHRLPAARRHPCQHAACVCPAGCRYKP